MKNLRAILENTTYQGDCPALEIEHISYWIVAGSIRVIVLIAYPGYQFDGRDYIETAIQKGATAVLYEQRDCKQDFAQQSVPCIAVTDLAAQLSLIAGNFYDHPSRKLDCIAITGTNGKTSISQFLAQALEILGKRAAIMGTMGIGTIGNLQPSHLTTADAITVQQILASFVEQGIEYVALEASSHALDQSRLEFIELNSAHFTNLTHEHLDYHQTMEAYGEAKAKLFSSAFLDRAVINVDDDFGQVLFNRFKKYFRRFRMRFIISRRTIISSRNHYMQQA